MEVTHDDELEIDLREIYFALKKRILVVLASGLLLGCIVCAYTLFFISPVYTSTSSMLVLTKETTLSSLADLQMGSQLTNDYKVLITSRPVLENVIEELKLDWDYKELKRMITLENPQDTRILEISFEDTDAERAATVVNKLAEISSTFIGEKMEVVPPKIIEVGEVPTQRTGPNMVKNALIGLLLGLVLSAGVVVAVTIMDDTIKSEEDIGKYLQLSTLASVPDRKDYINMGTGKDAKKAKKGGLLGNRRKKR